MAPVSILTASDEPWAREVAIVCAQMEGTPWAQTLPKAQRLVLAGAVARLGEGSWLVTGDSGAYTVSTAVRPSTCTCAAAAFRREQPCSHRTAVEVVQRCLAGDALFALVREAHQEKEATMQSLMEPSDVEAGAGGPVSGVFIPTGEAPAAPEEPDAPHCYAHPLALRTHVYQAIADVMARIAKSGVSKGRRNDQQNYAFRGIDDVQNALAPLLAEAGLLILPYTVSKEVTERTTSKGGTLISTTVEVEYTFLEVLSRTRHVVKFFGEGMDSGDKSLAKAMSAAYKTMAIEVFCIPVEGQPDADKESHDVAPSTSPAVPNMAPPAADYRAKIEDLLRAQGWTEERMDDYASGLKAKYGAQLPGRLPGIYKALAAKASSAAPVSAAEEAPW